MNQDFEMNGKVDISMFGVTLPAKFVSDDGATTTATEKVREIPTMAGTIRVPTGIYDEAKTEFTIVLPNMDFLKNVFPDLYQAGTGTQTRGRVAIGGNTCVARENTPLVVHYTCSGNSDNDVYLPNAAVTASFELTQNASDPVKVMVTANAHPDDTDGVLMYLGTGDLTEKTLWDPVTKQYEPVTS